MAAFGVSGLASGIDTKSLMDKLIESEGGTVRLAQSQLNKVQARLDAVRSFNTRSLAFRDALDRLRTTGDAFKGNAAVSGDTTKVTVAAGTNAIAGSYSVSVERLATASEVATAGQGSAAFAYTVGDIKLKLNGGSEVTIANTGTTLAEVATSINSANAGISASVVFDGSLNRLMVRSTTTGTAAGIEYVRGADAADNLFRDGAGVSTVSSLTTAQDAQIRLGGTGGFGVPGGGTGGLVVTRATNTVADLIPGATLTLKAGVNNLDVTVSQDLTSLHAAVQKVVDTYNDARSYFSTNATYDAATNKAGTLFNDRDLLRTLESASAALEGTLGTAPVGFQKLSELGITIGGDGKMAFSQTVFDAKLATNSSTVRSSVGALADLAGTALASLTEPTNGFGKSRDTLLADSVTQLNKRISSLNDRLTARRAYYEAKFLSMEKLTAQYQSQGNSLAAFTNGLTSKK